MTLWVAIVGSGPAGYYTAEALAKQEDVRVDIIDRLPTPYGLIRAGVAPDHQSIKNVSRRYEKTNLQDNVRFVGNLSLGEDIDLADLRELYDAVVLSTGAGKDRPLGIPGEDLIGVHGSGPFVGWYNGHPDYADLAPDLTCERVVVIGAGNVALDVARILARTPKEMAGTDLAPHAADRIFTSAIRDIHVIARRGPLEAAFSVKELGEMNKMERGVPLVDAAQLPTDPGEMDTRQSKNLALLQEFTTNQPGDKPIRIHLDFYARPLEIYGDEHCAGVTLERTKVEDGRCVGTGETFEMPCGLVVPCIGYRSVPIEGAKFDNSRGRFENEDGLIEPGLYVAGWARRGPTGTIGTNKPDGGEIANRILAEVAPSGKAGRDGLDRLADERGLSLVTFQDWKRIEEAEADAAQGDAPREKFVHVKDMLNVIEEDK